ncbi:MAG TPA: AsmA family protein [Stellaceae bacterium]
MKKPLLVVVAVILVLVVLVIAAPFLIPASAYRGQIEARVHDATGRDLRIAGRLSLSLFPDIRVVVNDASLTNPTGAASPTFASVKKLYVTVKLRPLLSGRLDIDRLALVDPTIALEIDAKGRPNWNFATADSALPGPAPDEPADNAPIAGLDALSRLQVKEIAIENGTITLLDRRTGRHEELTQGTATIAAPSLAAPFTLAGSALWRGQKLALTVKLDAAGALLAAGGKTGLAVALAAKPVTLNYRGSVSNTGKRGVAALRFDGNADLAIPSVRDFVTWSGQDITLPKHGFGALAVSGAVHGENGIAKFSDGKFTLDAIAATGGAALDVSGVRPAITANLRTGMLDLNPYLPPPVAGWATDPFDVAIFRGVDTDMTIAASGVTYRKMRIGNTSLTVHLKDAKLALTVGPMALYGGSGKGQVTLDATGPSAAVRIDGALSGVDVGALARDAAGIGTVAGTGTFTIAGTARGNSERDLIASLDGKATFRLSHGSVGGVDLGGMLKNSGGAFAAGGGRTAINSASGSFSIAHGIMRNGDLVVSTDTIDATGSGSVDLPARTLNYRITPRLVAGILTVPVTISGPWDHLSFQPDLAGIAKGVMLAPVNMLGGAAGVGKNLGGGIGGALKSLFGK